MCHWIARGVALDNDKRGDLTEVVEYKAPAPPAKTGKHRYVAVVYAPLNGTSEPLYLPRLKERARWGYDHHQGKSVGMRQWAEDMGLVPVGMYIVQALSVVSQHTLMCRGRKLCLFQVQERLSSSRL